jgi:hypothetical protein
VRRLVTPLLVALALAPAAGTAGPAPTLIAAGDVADCRSRGDEATARLVERTPGVVAVLGDSVYERGTAAEFARCYAPSWGRFRARTRPAVGNHEYGTGGAAAYFRYFGRRAGEPGRGWYAYSLGAWRVVVLNSNCARVGCRAGSPQERWLRAELAARPALCTLAYWHHPRFSSGEHGPQTAVAPLWRALAEHGAELVLSGHDHHYERFAPQAPDGRFDAAGIRQFVVGTGGRAHYRVRAPRPNSERRIGGSWGVLVLTLRESGYDWRYVRAAGGVADRGSGECG